MSVNRVTRSTQVSAADVKIAKRIVGALVVAALLTLAAFVIFGESRQERCHRIARTVDQLAVSAPGSDEYRAASKEFGSCLPR